VTFDDWRRLDGRGPSSDAARSHAAMARALWLLLGVGGLLALAIALLPHRPGLNETGFIGLAAVSLLAAGFVFASGPRLPILAAQAFCSLGIVTITLSIYWSGNDIGSAAENELLYLWPILLAGYFFSRRALAFQVALFAALYGLCMLAIDINGDETTRWIASTGGLAVAAVFVGYLRSRIDYELSLQQATIESTTDGILVVGSDGRWQSFNRKFLAMWRIPAEITSSRDDDAALEFVLDQVEDPAQFLAKVREVNDEPRAESYDEVMFKDGRVLERYSQPQLIDDRVVGRVWSFRDVTDRRRADERLQHLADHDPLTDLFNRRRFEEELTRELARSARYGRGGALLLLDLDDFKAVNDTYGHLWGDEVLRATARLLSSRLRTNDVFSRLGGDEFAVLLPEADEVRAVKLAEELLEVMRGHVFETERGELTMTTSVGLVTLDALAGSGVEPMAAADTGMYRAKHDGRDRLATFDPARDGARHGPANGSRRQA
jgi:diguanylate cyclase (GGDEF)-like protein